MTYSLTAFEVARMPYSAVTFGQDATADEASLSASNRLATQ